MTPAQQQKTLIKTAGLFSRVQATHAGSHMDMHLPRFAERAGCMSTDTNTIQEVLQLMQVVANVRLYLVHRTGPTSFVVREEESDIKRKVSVGERMTCSCCPVGTTGTCKELCVHILFVLIKVLRVPTSNPCVWQLSLTDRELEEVLRCSSMPQLNSALPASFSAAPSGTAAGQRARRSLGEEEPCPICYEDIHDIDLDLLVYCRHGCGHNIHGKCMRVWAEHQTKSLGKELTCPLCRSDWGDFKWRPPLPKRRPMREARSDVHLGTCCAACKKAPLSGKRFCCLVCHDYDLCEACFEQGLHPQHTFACRTTPTATATPANRPLMMPCAVQLGGSIAQQSFNRQTNYSSPQTSVSEHTSPEPDSTSSRTIIRANMPSRQQGPPHVAAEHTPRQTSSPPQLQCIHLGQSAGQNLASSAQRQAAGRLRSRSTSRLRAAPHPSANFHLNTSSAHARQPSSAQKAPDLGVNGYMLSTMSMAPLTQQLHKITAPVGELIHMPASSANHPDLMASRLATAQASQESKLKGLSSRPCNPPGTSVLLPSIESCLSHSARHAGSHGENIPDAPVLRKPVQRPRRASAHVQVQPDIGGLVITSTMARSPSMTNFTAPGLPVSYPTSPCAPVLGTQALPFPVTAVSGASGTSSQNFTSVTRPMEQHSIHLKKPSNRTRTEEQHQQPLDYTSQASAAVPVSDLVTMQHTPLRRSLSFPPAQGWRLFENPAYNSPYTLDVP